MMRADQRTVGIVTVLFKSANQLPEFISSIASNAGPSLNLRLYAIDNNETDVDKAVLDKCASQKNLELVYIKSDFNIGVAAGNNIGISQAIKDCVDFILLSNNDLIIPDFAISKLVNYSVESGAQIIVPKIYYYPDSNLIWYGGGAFDPYRLRAPHLHMGEHDSAEANIDAYVEYAPTCFMLIAPIVFSIVGLMDEKYFCYYDDTDFAYRVIKNKIKIKYLPSSYIFHKVSSSTGGDESPFSLYHMNRNRVYFAKKNLPLIPKVTSLIYMTATRLIYLFKLPRGLRRYVISGYWDGWKL
jgi:GT2 family glycosyltransferase